MAFPRMLRLIAATPFSHCRLLTAYQPTVPHIPIPSIESHHIPSVVFTRVCHPRSRFTHFCRSLLSSFDFRCLRRRHSSSANRTLLSNQSSLPLAPFPGSRRPRRFKQQGVTPPKVGARSQENERWYWGNSTRKEGIPSGRVKPLRALTAEGK